MPAFGVQIEKFRLLNLFRIILAAFFVYLSSLQTEHHLLTICTIVHAIFAIAWMGLIESDLLREDRHWWSGYIPATMDVLGVTIALLLTGHARSPLTAGYFGLAAIAATIQNRNYGWFVVGICISAYTLASTGVYLGRIPAVDVFADQVNSLSATSLIVYCILMATGLITVHTICYQFAKRNDGLLKDTRELLEAVARHEEQLRRRNAQMEQDLDLARSIHFRLLPESLPTHPRFDFATLYIPQDKVGGDLYDVRLEGDSLELFVVDVSGHGVSSAFLAAIFRVTMEHRDRSNPAAFLSSMNDVFFDRSFAGFFLTAFYGVLNTQTLQLRFARAGHPHPLLLRDGRVTEVPGRGGMVGASRTLDLEDATLQLMPGDRLCIYTDGIPEYQGANGSFFGEENLYSVLRESSGQPIAKLPTVLLSRLGEFGEDKSADDDMTLVALDVLLDPSGR